LSNSYRSGGTRVVGIVGAVVFFGMLAVTSSLVDGPALIYGQPTLISDYFDAAQPASPLPPTTFVGQFSQFLFWIGLPIALSLVAMWLALLVRDWLRRSAQ